MGGPYRLQLLKPNYTPIECTAEVHSNGLELLRVSGKPLFRFDFEKIQGSKCVSDENLELEVHMGNGKMGKVKLRCSGEPRPAGESPVLALSSDLEEALQRHRKAALAWGPPPRLDEETSPPSTPRTMSPPPSAPGTPMAFAMSPTQAPVIDPLSTPGARFASAPAMGKPSSVGTWGPGLQGAPVAAVSAGKARRTGTWSDHPDQAGQVDRASGDSRISPIDIKQAVERMNAMPFEPERRQDSDSQLLSGHQGPPKIDLDGSGNLEHNLVKKLGLEPGYTGQAEVQVIMHSRIRGSPVRDDDQQAWEDPGSTRPFLGGTCGHEHASIEKPRQSSSISVSASPCRPSLDQILHHQKEAAAYREELEATRNELSMAKADCKEQQGMIEGLRGQVSNLQAARQQMVVNEEEYKETVYKVNQAILAERKEKEQAVRIASEAKMELSSMEQQLQKVRMQVQEAEASAREADSACVAANEARAALRADLESANKQIERLREAKRDALERADELDSRGATNSEQVSMLKAELQRMDHAAERAMSAAKEEAARSQSLQAEVERLTLLLEQAKSCGTEDRETAAFLRQQLAEETARADKCQAELEERQGEVDEAHVLFASLREQQSEAEAARSAALSDAHAAHDEAMSAYREVGVAKAELRALKEQEAARRVNNEHAAEGLQDKLVSALREGRQHQAACRAAQEAMGKAQAEAEQASRRAHRLQVHTESLAEKAESLAQQLGEARQAAAEERASADAAQEQAAVLRQQLAMAEAEARSALEDAQRAAAYAKSSEGASERVQELLARLDQAKEQLQAERESNRRASEEIKRLKAAFGQAQQSLDWAHSSSKKSAKEVESAYAEREACKAETTRLRKKLEAADADRAKLEAELGEAKHFYRLLKDSGLTIRPADSAKTNKPPKEGSGKKKPRAPTGSDHRPVTSTGARHTSYAGVYDSLPFYPHPPSISREQSLAGEVMATSPERRGRGLVHQPGNRRPGKSPSPSPRTGTGISSRAMTRAAPAAPKLRRSLSGLSYSSIGTDQSFR